MTPPTTSGLARGLSGGQVTSKLGQQLSQRDDEADVNAQSSSETGNGLAPSSQTSPRSRSLSDSGRLASAQPPSSRDSKHSSTKDDISVPSPATPQRPSGIRQSLALNLPSKVSANSSAASRVPLSPKLDSSQIYGSPGSVLPRRSRGLDFSRACTNLHHSTLAESSPDSSPTIGGRGMNIPNRRGSHGSTSMHQLSTSGQADRPPISSSVSSVNMMESDTSSSEEDDEPMMGDRDEMINTPQVNKTIASNPFAQGHMQSPGNDWRGGYSQAASSLMSFQRARFGKNRSRHSSSSASGNSSKPSPAPVSPPLMRNIEGQGGHRQPRDAAHSRRESLSLGTRDLRLSDMSDDGEARVGQTHSPSASGSSEGGPSGVVRRAVTRRGNLLPKTKTFARIRAALMEEGAPIDSEAKRESEVIRQVRESEPTIPNKSPTLGEFPSLSPPGHERSSLDTNLEPEKHETSTPIETNFSHHANRNSAGQDFWNSFDERYRTPPPPTRPTRTSSISEDDYAMDMTPAMLGPRASDSARPSEKPSSRGSTPFLPPQIPSAADISRKRRREDDFDSNLFKRRAVSPSTSAQSSPIMSNSPAVKETGNNSWGPLPKSSLGPPFLERANQEGAGRNPPHNGTPRRVGLQGMTETSDGFMNMSIE